MNGMPNGKMVLKSVFIVLPSIILFDFPSAPDSVRHDREQDDGALNGSLPIRLNVQMRERRADARQQQ
jgi:hypothetical protein